MITAANNIAGKVKPAWYHKISSALIHTSIKKGIGVRNSIWGRCALKEARVETAFDD